MADGPEIATHILDLPLDEDPGEDGDDTENAEEKEGKR